MRRSYKIVNLSGVGNQRMDGRKQRSDDVGQRIEAGNPDCRRMAGLDTTELVADRARRSG